MLRITNHQFAGARVIGTGSASWAGALRALGAEPVTYGDGMCDRIRAVAPEDITAAVDLFGQPTLRSRRASPASRTTASPRSQLRSRGSHRPTGPAPPGATEETAALVAAGQLRVPITASFPIET